MRVTKTIVLAAGLCLLEATAPTNLGSAAAGEATAQQPLNPQLIALPSSIRGEEITSVTMSTSGLFALATAAGRLSIVDRDLRAWRGGWERSADSSPILRIAFSQDGAAIAGITKDAVFVWHVDDPAVTKMPIKVDPFSAMALSSGGRWLAVADFAVSVFDVSSHRLVRKFEQVPDEGGNSTYDDVAFTLDAPVVAAASVDNIDAWNIETGKRVQHWSCKCGADGVAFARDPMLAVVGTADAHALLWELASANVLKDKTMSVIDGDHVYGTTAILKGTLVAAGTASGWVVLWDTRSDTIVARVEAPTHQPITRITSSGDGEVLLVEGQKVEYVRGSYDRWRLMLPGR